MRRRGASALPFRWNPTDGVHGLVPPPGCGGGTFDTDHAVGARRDADEPEVFWLDDGQSPQGGLVEATAGHFYGTTMSGGAHNNGTVYALTTDGTPGNTTESVIYDFNASNDAQQLYFSDGLSENLIDALSRFEGLKVIGRTSAFQFRGSKDDSDNAGS